MEWFQALVPPSLLAVVVFYLVRDLKTDYRYIRDRLDGLQKDHNGLAQQLARIEGALTKERDT